MYALRGSTEARISDLGYCRGFQWFIHFVSETGRRVRTDFNPNPTTWIGTIAQAFHFNHQIGPCDSWGYPFHTGCWEVLVYLRAQQGIDAQALFNLLRSFRSGKALLNFGHDYDNLWMTYAGVLNDRIDERPFRNLTTRGPHRNPQSDMQWFEIMSLPILHDFFHNPYIGSDTDAALPTYLIRTRKQERSEYEDAFSVLSIDIYTQIIEYLSLRSVLNLQLASRACYNFGLNNSFWKSRFDIGYELDFIFRSDLPQSFPDQSECGKTWESLVKFVWSVQGSDRALKNRRRVWRLANRLLVLLDRIENASCCAGTAIRSTFEPMGIDDGKAWIAANYYKTRPEFSHFSGSTPMFKRTTELPLDAVSIYVSIVKFSGFTHITGLRMQTKTGEEASIGYNILDHEHLLTTERIYIAGFMVVSDYFGISGLAVISTSGHVSRWAGAHEGFAKRRLVLDSSPTPKAIKYIKGGFDVSYSTYCQLKEVKLCG